MLMQIMVGMLRSRAIANVRSVPGSTPDTALRTTRALSATRIVA
jgi:hypothetical protein